MQPASSSHDHERGDDRDPPATDGDVSASPLWAEIERCEMARAGELTLWGWSSSRDASDPVARVEIRLDGQLVGETTSFDQRADLKDRLVELGVLSALDASPRRDSRFRRAATEPSTELRCGWRCRCAIPEVLSPSEALLAVRAHTAGGRSLLVYLGSLDHCLARVSVKAMRRYSERVVELEEIIELMEQSFFWRLRTRWFWVKRHLGLTDER